MAEADAQPGQEAAAGGPLDYETVFTNAKAVGGWRPCLAAASPGQALEPVRWSPPQGMEDVDREHVKRVVYEMSKDSAHFKNEQRKTAQVPTR